MTPPRTCRVCGKPVPDDRRTLCSKYCVDEYNRRVNRAAYYRRMGKTPPPEKRAAEPKPVRVKLPPGAWFQERYRSKVVYLWVREEQVSHE